METISEANSVMGLAVNWYSLAGFSWFLRIYFKSYDLFLISGFILIPRNLILRLKINPMIYSQKTLKISKFSGKSTAVTQS